MKKRKTLKVKDTGGGNYFASKKKNIDFYSSGSTLLDQVLGGGFVLGRIANIVGDKSTGKTLLAIEATANFAKKYPEGEIYYREAEAAFDKEYANALGMPVNRINFGDEEIYTVEDFFEDLENILDTIPKNKPGLYVLDSLDALSDRAEQARAIDEGTFGANKAKQLSQLFRRLVKKVEKKKVSILIISQVRDNIGVSFGRKTTRSGGRALDFYSSQVLFLAHIKALDKTRKGVKRVYGIRIKAKCDKNKVGLPLRFCEFPILFGYGIDDIRANCEWLLEVKRQDAVGMTQKDLKNLPNEVEKLDDVDYKEISETIAKAVIEVWQEIEVDFLPTRRKYN